MFSLYRNKSEDTGGCEGPRADPINISSSIIPGVDVVYLGAESWRNSGETSVEESSFLLKLM